MTPESIALVRGSFARLAEHADQFAGHFYDALFRINPSARQLFTTDMSVQGEKLMSMLGAIVEGLDEPSRLHDMFAAMGERHAGYGVTEDHYDDVGVALLSCLRAALGADFTLETEEAWAGVYGEIAEAMIAAAQDEPLPS